MPGSSLFDRVHHVRVGRVLDALDAELLAAANCYFGGGTAIALRHGEYRESVDVDFVVSDISGYSALRVCRRARLCATTGARWGDRAAG